MMEEYSLQLNRIRSSCNEALQEIENFYKAKISELQSLKEAFLTDMMNGFCTEMIACVQDYIDCKNENMQVTIMDIDEGLSHSCSSFEFITDFRSNVIHVFNSVSSSSVAVDIGNLTNINDVGTNYVLEKMQEETKNVVAKINNIRLEHEPLFNEIQNELFAIMENAFNQLEAEIESKHATMSNEVKSIISEIERDSSISENIIFQISEVKNKIHALLRTVGAGN